jgi:pimeloyl-ACP methyl ester carboxylesterase
MERLLINGVGLELQRIAAPADGPARAPIIFLHEGLGCAGLWRDWPFRVCQITGRAGLIYSRRGYGHSDAVPDVRGPSSVQAGLRCGRLQPDYMHVEAWEVLPALLAALGIERPVLLGHSDGASIALLHASRHPLAACVVMAPHVVVEEVSLRNIAAARTAFETGALRSRLARWHRDVDCAFWQWNDVWLSEAFRSFDIRPECAAIRAPLLAMQGLQDAYGTLAQIHALRQKNNRQNRGERPNDERVVLHELKQCGHAPELDQPELSLRLIAEFLQTVD